MSVEISVSYLGAVNENETIDIHTKVTKRDEQLGWTEATVLNHHGDIVATGKQTCAIIGPIDAHLDEMESLLESMQKKK